MSAWGCVPPKGVSNIVELLHEETSRAKHDESLAADGLNENSEDALALRFSAQHADNLRYIAARGKWFIWDGKVWRPDDTLAVFDEARVICRTAAIERSEHGTHLAQASTVAAVERLARADRRHAATVDQWDTDPWLLNTPAGVVDLRTGSLRPVKPDDYMTKVTAAAPGGDCPLFLGFLRRVTGGDQALQDYLQRMCGYALTGLTEEHALFFLYGTGANGKTVFIRTITGVMNNYSRVAPIETFMDSRNERHPTDLAGLQGARLVTAVETEQGRRWAESKIKSLTGGDRISARFMRQDFFDFTPVFKLMVAGNHRPALRSVDEAMRRRIHLLPFTVTIPAEERDPELLEMLREESSGILGWMIEGCSKWHHDRLSPPSAVRDATEQYLAAEDSIGRWIDDCCQTSTGSWTPTNVLFRSWSDWCEQNQEHAGSQKRLTETLGTRGFAAHRTAQARGVQGILLRVDR